MTRARHSPARELLGRLERLEVAIEAAQVETAWASIPSYPGGRRPTSTVELTGHGTRGHGEHVGWTRSAHASFSRRVASRLPRGRRPLGRLSALLRRRFPDAADRAALEAAALWLALAQHRVELPELARIEPRPVRYVVSLDRRGDPVARIRAVRRARPGLEIKLDAGLRWSDAVLAALGRLGGIAVVDFKRRGSRRDHERFAHALPEAWLEDPGRGSGPAPAWLRPRLSLDGAIRSPRALAVRSRAPGAVNVKPARLGGVLAAVATVAIARERGVEPYFGGMFEVGVGRRQLLALAAVLAPEGPNDIAPIAHRGRSAPRPPRLLWRPGCGAVAPAGRT